MSDDGRWIGWVIIVGLFASMMSEAMYGSWLPLIFWAILAIVWLCVELS